MPILALTFATFLLAPGVVTHDSPASTAAQTSDAEQALRHEPTRFLRLRRGEREEPLALQTATVRYRAVEGDLTVDLIGVVGYYGLVSFTLNVFEVPVPDGEVEPLS